VLKGGRDKGKTGLKIVVDTKKKGRFDKEYLRWQQMGGGKTEGRAISNKRNGAANFCKPLNGGGGEPGGMVGENEMN